MSMNGPEPSPLSVVILSFLPDLGHALPLLRIGRELADAGYEVACYLPEECRSVVDRYGFRYVSLGPCLAPEQRQVLRELSMRSDAYMACLGLRTLTRRYWFPIAQTMTPKLAMVRDSLRSKPPRCLLVDPHVFGDWYERLAVDTGALLIRHQAEGTRMWAQRLHAILFGVQRRPEWVKRLAEAFFRRMQVLTPRVMNGLNWREYRAHRRSREQIQALLAANFPEHSAGRLQQLRITTGLGVLEEKYLSHCLNVEPTDQLYLAAIPDRDVGPLPKELTDWFTGLGGKPVVYLSFGTMARLNRRLASELVAALRRLDVAALWALPQEQQALLDGLSLPPALRVEPFVLQPMVLAHPAVRCFITHAGAGGAQEGVLSGTPMLCIPFMWDQYYGASVIELLGAGLMLHKQNVTADRVSKALETLLNDPGFQERSRQLSLDLAQHRAEHPVAELVSRCCGADAV